MLGKKRGQERMKAGHSIWDVFFQGTERALFPVSLHLDKKGRDIFLPDSLIFYTSQVKIQSKGH